MITLVYGDVMITRAIHRNTLNPSINILNELDDILI